MWLAARRVQTEEFAAAAFMSCGEQEYRRFWWNVDFSQIRQKHSTPKPLLTAKNSPRR
jgi:hypothetical protein